MLPSRNDLIGEIVAARVQSRRNRRHCRCLARLETFHERSALPLIKAPTLVLPRGEDPSSGEPMSRPVESDRLLIAAMIPSPGERFDERWTTAGYEDSGYDDVFCHDVPPARAAETRQRESDEKAKALRASRGP